PRGPVGWDRAVSWTRRPVSRREARSVPWGLGLGAAHRIPEDGPARALARISGARLPVNQLFVHACPSPDGQYLALPLLDDGTTNIWLISTVDGTMRQATDFGGRPVLIARRVSW